MLESGAFMAVASASKLQPAESSGRLVSLDVFRGATIALMILVNTAGGFAGSYAPLVHADWDGWTPTDAVFPSFLWIVGLSLTLSLERRLSAGTDRAALIPAILRRALILYLLGVFLYLFPRFDFATARLLGVLQRIAICYAAASLIYLYSGVRGQIAWIAGLLGTYTLLMLAVPTPGYGPGRLDVEGNLAHYVDRVVLGQHNYVHTKTWDPEGIVSTIPAIATALLGVMAAHILRLQKTLSARAMWLFLTGVALIAAGLLFSSIMPINKKLWSTSFTLFMAGLDFVIFAGLLSIVDGQRARRWTSPFVIFGMNSIVVYMVAELGETLMNTVRAGGLSIREWVYQHYYVSWLSPANASLAFSLTYVAIMLVVAYWMYRRHWFVRV
jgi:predicted acyltransferase